MKSRHFVRGALLALSVAMISGCGKEEEIVTTPGTGLGPAGGGASAGPAKLTAEELDTIEKLDTSKRLVLIVKTRNNPFFSPMIEAAEAEAKALGLELEVQAPPQETDKEQQFSIVQTVIAKGADAILIAPADSKAIVPALKQAQEKGILVINLDNRVDKEAASMEGLELGGYVGADNEEGGRLAGEALAEALGGNGKVLMLEGIRGADNAEARKRGFEKGIAGKLTVAASDTAEWDTEKAYQKCQSLLAVHKDAAGLFCANDKMALGAMQAIQEAGLTGKLKVVGFDNIADVQPHLKSGAMVATIEQHPDLMGKYGVRMAAGILAGKVKKGGEFLVTLEVVKKQ